MDDYSNYPQKFMNSGQYFYLKNLNNLENNMLSDLDEFDDDLLSYNNNNIDYNLLLSGIGNKKQNNQNALRNRPNIQNNNYFNNNKAQNLRQRADYMNFHQNNNNNKRNIIKNQRQNLIYNNNINNNLNPNFIEEPENQNTIIHFYQPIYNNNIQKQPNQRKYYSKDGKVFIINNDPINNLNRRNNMNNNAKLNNYINSNSDLFSYNGYYLNNNNINIQNFVKQNYNNNGKINNQRMKKSTSNYGQNIINLVNNNNQRGINPQMNYNNLNNINNNLNNNILRKKQNILNNNKINNINNARINQMNIRDNILNNNRNNQIKNKINRNKKIIAPNRETTEDDEENLSNIAEDLVEAFNYTSTKKNNLEKNITPNKNQQNLNQIKNDINNIPLKKDENQKQRNDKIEFGCQTSNHLEQNKINKLKNFNINLNDKTEIAKQKIEKKDQGTDIQASLLQFIEPLSFQKKNNLLNNEKKDMNIQTEFIEEKNIINKDDLAFIKEDEKEKINNGSNNLEDKKEKEIKIKNINDINSNGNSNIIHNNKEEDLISENSEIPLDKNINNQKIGNLDDIKNKPINNNLEVKKDENNNLININELDKQNGQTEDKKENIKNTKKEKESLILVEENKMDDNIFGEYIDTDKEVELEKGNNKEKRHIKIDLDQNNYFNFLTGGLITSCQIRRGLLGTSEPYEEKKLDIHHTLVVFKKKPTIKEYDKNDIKINKNYILCENLTEEEIMPDLYEDLEIKDEVQTDNHVKELATTLKRSIDKSINSSINSSVQQSYNQAYNQSYNPSYADGIYDSLHGSKINTPGDRGILHRLNQVFGSITEVPE